MGKRTKTPQPTPAPVAVVTPAAPDPAVPSPTPEEAAATAKVTALQARRAALLAELNELDDQLAELQPHLLVTSKITNPVDLCRKTFLAMVVHAPTPARRRDVVAALVNKGVAPNTAKTQFQVNKGRWERGDFADTLPEE